MVRMRPNSAHACSPISRPDSRRLVVRVEKSGLDRCTWFDAINCSFVTTVDQGVGMEGRNGGVGLGALAVTPARCARPGRSEAAMALVWFVSNVDMTGK